MSPAQRRVWAHPRSRGENYRNILMLRDGVGSSPLTRGKRDVGGVGTGGGGLIPAHAGKTPRTAGCPGRWRAHPRSRGENISTVTGGIKSAGSSPLTRGKPDSAVITALTTRLIPAHAGKTLMTATTSPGFTAHPRSRGENLITSGTYDGNLGSSPLTRGKRPP